MKDYIAARSEAEREIARGVTLHNLGLALRRLAWELSDAGIELLVAPALDDVRHAVPGDPRPHHPGHDAFARRLRGLPGRLDLQPVGAVGVVAAFASDGAGSTAWWISLVAFHTRNSPPAT